MAIGTEYATAIVRHGDTGSTSNDITTGAALNEGDLLVIWSYRSTGGSPGLPDASSTGFTSKAHFDPNSTYKGTFDVLAKYATAADDTGNPVTYTVDWNEASGFGKVIGFAAIPNADIDSITSSFAFFDDAQQVTFPADASDLTWHLLGHDQDGEDQSGDFPTGDTVLGYSGSTSFRNAGFARSGGSTTSGTFTNILDGSYGSVSFAELVPAEVVTTLISPTAWGPAFDLSSDQFTLELSGATVAVDRVRYRVLRTSDGLYWDFTGAVWGSQTNSYSTDAVDLTPSPTAQHVKGVAANAPDFAAGEEYRIDFQSRRTGESAYDPQTQYTMTVGSYETAASTFTAGAVTDTDDPVVTWVYPLDGNASPDVEAPATVTVVVDITDASTIDRTRIRVQKRVSGSVVGYWNGTDYSTTTSATYVDAVNTTGNRWEVPIDIDTAATYRIGALVNDSAGNVRNLSEGNAQTDLEGIDPPAALTVGAVSGIAENVELNSPAQLPTHTVALSGGPDPVTSVAYLLERSDGRHWNGTAWVVGETSGDFPGEQGVDNSFKTDDFPGFATSGVHRMDVDVTIASGAELTSNDNRSMFSARAGGQWDFGIVDIENTPNLTFRPNNDGTGAGRITYTSPVVTQTVIDVRRKFSVEWDSVTGEAQFYIDDVAHGSPIPAPASPTPTEMKDYVGQNTYVNASRATTSNHPIPGVVHSAVWRLDNAIVAEFDPTALDVPAGATTFTDTAGKVWTKQGGNSSLIRTATTPDETTALNITTPDTYAVTDGVDGLTFPTLTELETFELEVIASSSSESASSPVRTFTTNAADVTPPTVAINDPSDTNVHGDYIINGTSSDLENTVAAVKVRVRRMSDGLYWNDATSTWAADQTLFADVDSLDGSGNWAYTVNIDTDSLYLVDAYAVDDRGNQSGNTTASTFYVDTVDPVALVDAIADTNTADTQRTFTGTFSDATAGVSTVRVRVRRQLPGSSVWEYHDGTDGTAGTPWTTASTNEWHEATLDGSTWSTTRAEMQGDGFYQVSAFATDTVGNLPPANNRDTQAFTVDTVAPTTAHVYPAANEEIPPGTRTLTGTYDVGDGSDIASVSILLRRGTTGNYEYWDGVNQLWTTTQWQNSSTQGSVTLDTTAKTWALPDVALTANEVYQITAAGQDLAGNSQGFAGGPVNDFTTAAVLAAITIDDYSAELVPYDAAVFEGTADPNATNLRIRIVNLADGTVRTATGTWVADTGNNHGQAVTLDAQGDWTWTPSTDLPPGTDLRAIIISDD